MPLLSVMDGSGFVLSIFLIVYQPIINLREKNKDFGDICILNKKKM